METQYLVSLIMLASLSLIIMISQPVNAATTFTVGDEKGWTLGFDYKAWAQDKQFHIGDILVFNYPKDVHNVLLVNGSSFANCVKEPIFSGLKLESGQDKLEIKKSGNIWFICGVGMLGVEAVVGSHIVIAKFYFSVASLGPKNVGEDDCTTSAGDNVWALDDAIFLCGPPFHIFVREDDFGLLLTIPLLS
ncbi:hypothetical protein SUGI_0873070 [Cryptomeria japonica]|nr:hypothetical protein SUGI_0873070 [Cryptomeria japonica]